MKKLLVLFASLFIICSCSMDDGNTVKFHFEFVPVHDYVMPDYITPGQPQTITLTYSLPNDCYVFDGVRHEEDQNIVTMALQTIVLENSECGQEVGTTVVQEVSFDFICSEDYEASNYIFKFYRGTDEQGNNLYHEVIVPVYK